MHVMELNDSFKKPHKIVTSTGDPDSTCQLIRYIGNGEQEIMMKIIWEN